MKLDAIQQAAQEQFGRQSERYGQGHILQNIEDVREAVARIPLPLSAQVLDVATGAGHTGLYLASLGHKVTVADIAQPMLERAAKTAAERGWNIQTCQCAAEDVPCENEKFDLVSCRVAAHHFSSPEKFICETSRVLKRGGHFLLIDGTVEDHQPEAEAWAHTVEKLRDPSHHRFLTPNAWKTLCATRSGFLSNNRICNGILKPPPRRRKTARKFWNWWPTRRNSLGGFFNCAKRTEKSFGGGND